MFFLQQNSFLRISLLFMTSVMADPRVEYVHGAEVLPGEDDLLPQRLRGQGPVLQARPLPPARYQQPLRRRGYSDIVYHGEG